MSDLIKIESRISAIKTELSELETAARVIRRLSENGADNGHVGLHKPKAAKQASVDGSGSFAKLKMIEAAKIVLGERTEPLHFLEIANESIKRGYKGKKKSTPESIRKSFWAALQRNPDIFTKHGAGRYGLTANA